MLFRSVIDLSKSLKSLVSTTSYQMLTPQANAVGANHCQSGKEANIYEIKQIEIVSSSTGGKRTRRNKNRKTIKNRKYIRKTKKSLLKKRFKTNRQKSKN